MMKLTRSPKTLMKPKRPKRYLTIRLRLMRNKLKMLRRKNNQMMRIKSRMMKIIVKDLGLLPSSHRKRSKRKRTRKATQLSKEGNSEKIMMTQTARGNKKNKIKMRENGTKNVKISERSLMKLNKMLKKASKRS